MRMFFASTKPPVKKNGNIWVEAATENCHLNVSKIMVKISLMP